MSTRHDRLRLVPAPTFAELDAEVTAARRARTRAAIIARIAGRIPEREDVRTHPGGHVWRCDRKHERLVLLAKGRLER